MSTIHKCTSRHVFVKFDHPRFLRSIDFCTDFYNTTPCRVRGDLPERLRRVIRPGGEHRPYALPSNVSICRPTPHPWPPGVPPEAFSDGSQGPCGARRAQHGGTAPPVPGRAAVLRPTPAPFSGRGGGGGSEGGGSNPTRRPPRQARDSEAAGGEASNSAAPHAHVEVTVEWLGRRGRFWMRRADTKSIPHTKSVRLADVCRA